MLDSLVFACFLADCLKSDKYFGSQDQVENKETSHIFHQPLNNLNKNQINSIVALPGMRIAV